MNRGVIIGGEEVGWIYLAKKRGCCEHGYGTWYLYNVENFWIISGNVVCLFSSVLSRYVTLSALTLTTLSDLSDAAVAKESHAVSGSNFDLIFQYVGCHLIVGFPRYPDDRRLGFFRSVSTNCRIFTYLPFVAICYPKFKNQDI